MNTLELEAYKAELAREVLNTNDPDVLDTVKDIMRKSGNNENPCRMSIKEAQKQLQDSERRFEKGEYIREEDMEDFYNALQ